jgi:polar amino acid transport system substrate-binding protein
MSAALRILAAAAALFAAHGAWAGCSREIAAPLSPTGATVRVKDGVLSGAYPDVLRGAAKAGCSIAMQAVPRARLEWLFENGQSDLLLPASRTPSRDKAGIFVPMISNRPTIISLGGSRPPLVNAADLLARQDLRVVVVRGYNYGEAYEQLLQALEKQGRLYREVDATAVARLMLAGAAELTIMSPTVIFGLAQAYPDRVPGLAARLRIEPLPELPWVQDGVYLSRQTLSPEDRNALREVFEKAARNETVLEAYRRHYSAEVLRESIRPR